jgi:hypothetical protein
VGGVVAAGVRSAAQQVLSRSSAPPPLRPSQPQREIHVNVAEVQRRSMEMPAAPRAFGAAAIHDEATLDIPAYIRRSRT